MAARSLARPGITITHLRDRALSARADRGGYVIALEQGGEIAADIMVLAVSHPAPAAPPLVAALGDDPAIIQNPWLPECLESIPAEHKVLIIGTGLTMADVVASLARRNHRGRIVAFSRRGQLSRGHAFGAAPFAWFAHHEPPRSAAALMRKIRELTAGAARDNLPWQAVLDDARANAKLLWGALDATERRRLLRHLRPFWDSHRYRVAPQVERIVADKRADGSLLVLAASLRAASWKHGRIELRLHERAAPPGDFVTFVADSVIVTTGPAHGSIVGEHPVLASLAASGALQADPLGLGIAVDESSRVVRQDGTADPGLYVAGPLAREQFGELMGLPQVAAQPSEVAGKIAARLRNAPHGDECGSSDRSA